MRVSVVEAKQAEFKEEASCLVVPVFEGGFPLLSEVLAEDDEYVLQTLADQDILTGKASACYYFLTPSGRYKGVLALGLGKKEGFDAEALRRAAGAACAHLGANRVAHVYFDATAAEVPADAFLEGIALGQYDFDVYKKAPEGPAPVRVAETTVLVRAGVDRAETEEVCTLAVLVSVGANGARHLANTPPNEMGPSELAEFARGIAKESDCVCTVLEPQQMASLGMNALLGVAQGSARPPRLIVLDYRHPEATRTVAMVGKGVTFDTGGISLKPGQDMHEMKYDMCGAAAVLCAMMSIVQLKPKLHVVCVVPAVENMPDADAQRPGDIVKAYNGKTIEIHNTDAEGRLILADALAYVVDKYKPEAVVDLATLTGAVVVALGHYAAGLCSNDDALAEALVRAGEATGERVWRLPLWKEYAKLIEGTHADICNIGPRGEAGTIIGAAFLQHFVGETKWAHLDIAGTAWGGKHIGHLDAKHATGYGVRLLVRWLLAEAAR